MVLAILFVLHDVSRRSLVFWVDDARALMSRLDHSLQLMEILTHPINELPYPFSIELHVVIICRGCRWRFRELMPMPLRRRDDDSMRPRSKDDACATWPTRDDPRPRESVERGLPVSLAAGVAWAEAAVNVSSLVVWIRD